jgi:probable phosphoglycerate mutase
LLRHGRTAWNHVRRAQGHADVSLDKVGRAQAAAVAPLIATQKPSRLWSSDLARATETAAAVSAACGLPVETDKRLREYDVGERQGLTWAESVDRFPWISEGADLRELLERVPGAESYDDVRLRIVPAVEEYAAALAPGQTGVVVTHGAALTVALAGLLGWEGPMAWTLAVLGNCQWTTVRLDEERGLRKLVDYGVGDFATHEGIG